MFFKVVKIILENLPETLSIILFGSYARFGKGNDIYIAVIIRKNINLKEKEEIERKLMKILDKEFEYKFSFDVHVLSLKIFEKKVEPPRFLSGIFLGYEILYGKINIKKIIEEKRRKLKCEYTYVDKFGTWKI